MNRYKSLFTEAPSTKNQLWYMGWRSNPQLKNGGYNVAYGQLSKTDAKKKTVTVYGGLSLTPYNSEVEYLQAIKALQDNGERVVFN
jgi:hypothetical protein